MPLRTANDFAVLCSQDSYSRVHRSCLFAQYPFSPTYVCFIPPSKSSFVVLLRLSIFFPTISFTVRFLAITYPSHPVLVLVDVYIACAFLLAVIASFTSPSQYAPALLHAINFSPISLLVVVLTNFSRPFGILASALSLPISFFVGPIFHAYMDVRHVYLLVDVTCCSNMT